MIIGTQRSELFELLSLIFYLCSQKRAEGYGSEQRWMLIIVGPYAGIYDENPKCFKIFTKLILPRNEHLLLELHSRIIELLSVRLTPAPSLVMRVGTV